MKGKRNNVKYGKNGALEGIKSTISRVPYKDLGPLKLGSSNEKTVITIDIGSSLPKVGVK